MRHVLASFLVLCAACGGGVSVDELAEELPAAVCASAERCSPGLLSDDCETLLAGQLRATGVGGLRAAVEAGTVEFDEDKASDCLDAYAELDCGAEGPEELCEAATRGTVAEGGPCNIDEECAGDEGVCVIGAACPGRCARRVGAGERCAQTGCVDGFFCAGDSEETATCMPDVALGGDCSGGESCASGLTCLGPDGKCQPRPSGRKAMGEPCTYGESCEDGLACIAMETEDDTTFACAPRVGAGEPCPRSITQVCPDDQFCLFGDGEMGTCTPTRGAEESCESSSECGSGLVCAELGALGEKCVAPKNNDEACRGPDECFSGICTLDKCAAPPLCEAEEDDAPTL